MMRRHDYLLRCLLAVLTVIPPSLLAITIARCFVDVPYWDQWNFIGLGRMEKGSVQAMSNRYVTISLLLWVSSLVLLFMCSAGRKRASSGRSATLARGAVTVAVLAVCFSIARTSYRVGASVLTSYHDKLAPVRAAIREGNESAELLRQLYPHPDYVREGLEILKKHKLSVYRGI